MTVRRVLVIVFAVASFLIGASGTADAMRDPFPTCIRECSPVPELPELPPLPDPGPCHGALDGFC
jgi:hypothetical protein